MNKTNDRRQLQCRLAVSCHSLIAVSINHWSSLQDRLTAPPRLTAAHLPRPWSGSPALWPFHAFLASCDTVRGITDVKKSFALFFYFGHVFYVFLTFFIFETFFLFLKYVGKVRSKQINKKHFQNNSNEIDLWFFCCMSNNLKCLPINFYLLTMFDACLNGIFWVALKAISCASGVELNYTKKS